MSFNETQCYIMSIHRQRTPSNFNYSLNGHILQKVKETPYLGVHISNNLKWSNHIAKTCSKANSTLGVVKRNLKHCPQNVKEQAYISIVRPVLEYASSVWDPHLQKDIQRLENVQRRAARFVCNNYNRDSSVTQMLEQLHWRPLSERRKHHRLTLLSKTIKESIAIPTSILEQNKRKQRHQNQMAIKHVSAKTDTFKYSFLPRTICDWNPLPNWIVQSTSPETFLASVQTFKSQ